MRKRKFTKLKILVVFVTLVTAVLWWASRPTQIAPHELHSFTGNAINGERVFHLGGCASCHGEMSGDRHDLERMGGGLELVTPVGLFRVPNISSDPVWGIGAWTQLEFINAMKHGVSPRGQHYFPAFPYTSYTRMKMQDLVDLKAYLDALPPVDSQVKDHELKWFYRMRWPLGIWKRLYLDSSPVATLDGASPEALRGRYLAEGAGHCGECHTPRNLLNAMNTEQWMGGARNPAGEGKVPNITPDSQGIAAWSQSDLAYYFETGVDPEFDMVGGEMVKVQENLSRLTEEDRLAIAAYLKSLPAWPGAN